MHAVCETAYAKTDGHLCHLTDSIRCERVNKLMKPASVSIPAHTKYSLSKLLDSPLSTCSKTLVQFQKLLGLILYVLKV